MATKEKDTNKELEVEEIVSRSEQFIENNSKKIIYGIIALALVVGAVLGIKHGYLIPQEKKAAAAMFKGEQYFAKDSFNLALNGNGADYEGFEAHRPVTWQRLMPVSAISRWATMKKHWIC